MNNYTFPDHSGKRYRTFDSYLRERFGCKVIKIGIDGGFTCPNRDGTKSFGGCSFCAGGGAEKGRVTLAANGDFSAESSEGCGKQEVTPQLLSSLRAQYEQGREKCAKKWGKLPTVVYFQSYSSTYAPAARLRLLYDYALSFPDVRGLTIATRADCLPDETLSLLSEYAAKTELTVELGLQSTFDESARRIGRGHTYAEFLSSYEKLKERGIPVCVHLINGLPGESAEMMIENAVRTAALQPDIIKLHALYIRSDAQLARDYKEGKLRLLSREEYVDIVVRQIELIPSSITLERLTGDPARSSFLAPEWALDKKKTRALIDKTLAEKQTFQGICANCTKLKTGILDFD